MFEGEDSKGRPAGGSLLSGRRLEQRMRPTSRAGGDPTPQTGRGGSLLHQKIEEAEAREARSSYRSQAARDYRGTEAPYQPQAASDRREAPAAPPSYHSTAPQDDEWQPLIDAGGLLSALYRARYFIATMTVLGGLAGVAYALTIPKLYESQAELLIDPRDLKLVERELTSTNLPFDATLAIVESQMRIIMSRKVMLDVIEKLKLEEDPEFNGLAPIDGIPGFIRSLTQQAESNTDAMLQTKAIEKLYERVSLWRNEKSFIVNVIAKSEDPAKAARIANEVTEAYIRFQATLQAGTATQASGTLSKRLDELADKLEQSERAVEEFKAENDLLDAQGRLIGDEELLRINDQLAAAKASTIALNARASSTSNLTAEQVVAGNLPEQVNSPVIASLRSQYAGLKQQYDAVSVKLGPKHPTLISLDNQLSSMRQEIDAEIRRINSAIQVDLKRAVQNEQELASRLAQIKARQSGSKGELVELRKLEREASADRAVYEEFLLRARQTGEQSNISTANIARIAEAVPAIEPSGGSRKVVAIAGTIAGFLLGTLIAALRSLLGSLLRGPGGFNGSTRTEPRPRVPVPPPPPPAPEGPEPDGGFEWYRRRRGELGEDGSTGETRGTFAKAAALGKAIAASGRRRPRPEPVADERHYVDERPAPSAAQPPAMSAFGPQPAAPWLYAAQPAPVMAYPYPQPVIPPMPYWPMPQPQQTQAQELQAAPVRQEAPSNNSAEIHELRETLGEMRRAVTEIAKARLRRTA